MISNDPPLETGELLLQFWRSSPRARRQIAFAHGRRWVVPSSLVVCTPASVAAVGLYLLDPRLLPVSLLLFVVGVLLAGLLPAVYLHRRQLPTEWWVTSRRLVLVNAEGGTTELPLSAITDIDFPSEYGVRLATEGGGLRIRATGAPLALWGAVVMGKRLGAVEFPPVLKNSAEPTVSRLVAWNGEATSTGRRMAGVLVLRDERVAFLPGATETWGQRLEDLGHLVAGKVLGYRRTRLTPEYPMDGLIFRLSRLRDPAAFDATLEAIVRAWGGVIRHAPLEVEASPRAGGLDLQVQLGETTVRAREVSHPDLVSILDALGKTVAAHAASSAA